MPKQCFSNLLKKRKSILLGGGCDWNIEDRNLGCGMFWLFSERSASSGCMVSWLPPNHEVCWFWTSISGLQLYLQRLLAIILPSFSEGQTLFILPLLKFSAARPSVPRDRPVCDKAASSSGQSWEAAVQMRIMASMVAVWKSLSRKGL